MMEIRRVKYLNNILERNHRLIKRMTKPLMGFKAFHSTSANITSVEVAHMTRKCQLANDIKCVTCRKYFVILAQQGCPKLLDTDQASLAHTQSSTPCVRNRARNDGNRYHYAFAPLP